MTLAPETAADLIALLERSPDVLTRYAPDGTILYMSPSVERTTGRPAEEFVGRRMEELGVPSDVLAIWQAGNARVIATGEPLEAEFAFTGPAGPRTYHTVVVPESGPDGRVVSVLTVTRDVTAYKQAEAAARETAHTIRGLVEQSLTGVYVVQDGRLRYANRRLAEIFGGTVEQLLALESIAQLAHPDDRGWALEQLQRRLDDGAGAHRGTVQFGFRGRRLDGAEIRVEVHSTITEFGGRPAAVGVLLDVTERVRQEEALRRSEARFRALVEHSADLITVIDEQGKPSYWSPSYRTVLGYTAEELQSADPWRRVHPDDLEPARRDFERALARGVAVSERPVRVRGADGLWHMLVAHYTDLRGDPAVRGIVVNLRDVTEQVALEQQLRQAQKMEALGQLAGGVAHDFNNVLAAITGYAQLLREEIAEGDPRRADVDEILSAATRAAGVTKQLLAFSRHQALETTEVDLADVARRTCGLLRALIPATIDLRCPDERTPPCWVRGDSAQLEQVVMNLALNARDAMPRGGLLRVEVAAALRSPAAHAPSAVLRVEDTGHGMSPEVQARIFEPFFTTKERGKGTGLGLAMVYGIVRQLGGDIRVDSIEGQGTSFTVTFPLVAEPRQAAARRPEPAPAPERRTLLVVEDDRAVRESARRLLERAGYRVLTAEHGAAALRTLAAHEGAVDAVLTDAEMPELSGREFAACVAERFPGLPLVVMSGYTAPDAGGGEAWPGVVAFVQKPFLVGQLLDTVRETVTPRDAADHRETP